MWINFTLTVEYRTRSQTSAREICGGKSYTGTVLCQNASDFPRPYHPTNAPHTSLSCYLSYHNGERGKTLIAFKQSEFFSDVEQRWTKEKVLHVALFYFSNIRTRCLVFRRKYVS